MAYSKYGICNSFWNFFKATYGVIVENFHSSGGADLLHTVWKFLDKVLYQQIVKSFNTEYLLRDVYWNLMFNFNVCYELGFLKHIYRTKKSEWQCSDLNTNNKTQILPHCNAVISGNIEYLYPAYTFVRAHQGCVLWSTKW